MSSDARPRISAIQILRLPQVCQRTGLSRAMIYRLQAAQRFPQSVKITVFATGWIEEEVQAWLVQRIKQSRPQPSTILPITA